MGKRESLIMATITGGTHDDLVNKIKGVLEEYEKEHPTSQATLYRQNSGSIRIRIVDERFAGRSRGDRHDDAWNFISSRLSDDDIQEISILLLLTVTEQRSSIMNAEFDEPIPSSF
jgi:stress-induced morphogen